MTLQTSTTLHLFKENKKTHSKQNRAYIRSLGDVLKVIRDSGREGVIISIISLKANLSHNPALKHCSKLISAGLVESPVIDKRKVYVITPKGQEFFSEYQSFQNMAESLSFKF